MPSISSAYRGPLIIMGLGGGFSVVGAVPVAITVSIGARTSATIIGMGFIAFGFLLMLPGMFWCVVVRTNSFKACCYCCRKKKTKNNSGGKNGRRRKKKWGDGDDDDDDEEFGEEEDTPALCYDRENSSLESSPSREKTKQVPRERRWPPVYVDTPSLIITRAQDCLYSCETVQMNDINAGFVPSPNNIACNITSSGVNNHNNKITPAHHQIVKLENIVTKKIKALYHNAKRNKSDTNLHLKDEYLNKNKNHLKENDNNNNNNNDNMMTQSFTASKTYDPIVNNVSTTTGTPTAEFKSSETSCDTTTTPNTIPKSQSHNASLASHNKLLDECGSTNNNPIVSGSNIEDNSNVQVDNSHHNNNNNQDNFIVATTRNDNNYENNNENSNLSNANTENGNCNNCTDIYQGVLNNNNGVDNDLANVEGADNN